MADGAGGPGDGAPPSRRVLRRAENGELVSYSRDEYGVRKDDGGGIVKPVTSVVGLLVLSLLLSAIACAAIVATAIMAAQSRWDVIAGAWWVYLAVAFATAAGWVNFAVEFRAAKLRKRRGLPRPID
ncbi:MAG: hypothetical protein HOQ07_08055 [Sinomonas sp.]|jgi:hypothetical protein|nr:hypothetical protein [Sinomonas sp.]